MDQRRGRGGRKGWMMNERPEEQRTWQVGVGDKCRSGRAGQQEAGHAGPGQDAAASSHSLLCVSLSFVLS